VDGSSPSPYYIAYLEALEMTLAGQRLLHQLASSYTTGVWAALIVANEDLANTIVLNEDFRIVDLLH
jgi:hypothetical protein